ncbi:hypothetical protein P3G55_14285 [Leptospira sp. 96542]|nr:hypothetical protein [Leptospira sp. 96542]
MQVSNPNQSIKTENYIEDGENFFPKHGELGKPERNFLKYGKSGKAPKQGSD